MTMIRRAVFIIAALACASAAAPVSAAQTASPQTFSGFPIGVTATSLVATAGEPVLRQPASSGGFNYLYLSPNGNALAFVHVVRGNVVGVGVKPAPFPLLPSQTPPPMPSALGVALGAPAASLAAIPKERWFGGNAANDHTATGTYRGDDGLLYSFTVDGGSISWILAQLPGDVAAALPTAQEPALHGGTSIADAIVLIAASDPVGVRSEYVYLAAHPCAPNSSWKPEKQALLNDKGRDYDRLDVSCNGAAQRAFYFDITGYFGKT